MLGYQPTFCSAGMEAEKMLLVDKLARLAKATRSWWRKTPSSTRSVRTRLLT
jgi:hypothetical protein